MVAKLKIFWVSVVVIGVVFILAGVIGLPDRTSVTWLIGGIGFMFMAIVGFRADWADFNLIKSEAGNEYQKLLLALDEMIAAGIDNTDEAEQLRQKMD